MKTENAFFALPDTSNLRLVNLRSSLMEIQSIRRLNLPNHSGQCKELASNKNKFCSEKGTFPA